MNQKAVKDYYAVLGVSQHASLEEIRLAYRRCARAFHPDLSTDPDAEARFKEINEAYEVLANAEKRRAYDYFTAGASSEDAVDQVSPVVPPPPTAGRDPDPVYHAPPVGEATERKRIYPPTWAILLIIVGGCVMVSVAAGMLLSLRRNRPTGGAEPAGVTKLTTFISPPLIPDHLTVLLEDNMPLRTVAPAQLNIAGTTYPVAAVLPEQGRWPLPAEQDALALWIHGTLVNYVIGLPYTEWTEALLAGLESGDRITMTLENGSRLVFASPQVKRIDATDLSPMVQDKPEITLLILGNDRPNRLMVKARYLPEDVLPETEQRAEGLLVQVDHAGIVSGDTSTGAASWPFVVEYFVTNTGNAPVDPAFFDMVLEDGRGQRYIYNADAASRGQYGPLTGSLPPGATGRGSAGYLIPADAVGPLVWIFRADATSNDPARFVTDFRPPAPRPAAPDVSLTDAFLDSARDVMVISGTVYNDGELDLDVTANDIEATSGAGRSTLVVSSPQLPWRVPSDGYLDFELQFSVPAGQASVLLNVLGFTFEIEGLTP